LSPPPCSRARGQLSLEYLLLLAVSFSILAFMLPLLQGVYSSALHAMDATNAGRFAASLQQGVDELSFLGDGSKISASPSPFTRWAVYSEGKSLVVSVEGGAYGSARAFRVFFPNDVSFGRVEFSERKGFLLEKESGAIYLKIVS